MSPSGPKRTYLCTSCGGSFESAAKSVRNARHNCPSGERGTGRPIGTDGKPEPTQYAVKTAEREQEAQVDHIPGDVDFDVPPAMPDEPEVEYDETPVGPSTLPPEQEAAETPPEAAPAPADYIIDPESQEKLRALAALFEAITGDRKLSAEQEQYLWAEALGGLVGISMEAGQPFVIPGWVYSAAVGAGLLAYKTGIMKPAVRPKQTTFKPDVQPDRKDRTSERGGFTDDWGDA